MNTILRNIFVGALLLLVWGFVFASTAKVATAEEPTEDTPTQEIYLFCGHSEDDFSAILIRPEKYVAIMKHITWDKPVAGYILKMPEEYVIIVQHEQGYNSYYIDRYNLDYEIVYTINTIGKEYQPGGKCRIADR